ncbi:MAG: hypothetical protein AB7P04_04920 [Bacteriovoracia bacterium]
MRKSLGMVFSVVGVTMVVVAYQSPGVTEIAYGNSGAKQSKAASATAVPSVAKANPGAHTVLMEVPHANAHKAELESMLNHAEQIASVELNNPVDAKEFDQEVLDKALSVLKDAGYGNLLKGARFGSAEKQGVNAQMIEPQTYVFYPQLVDGVPVEGCGTTVMVKGGKIVNVDANLAKNPPAPGKVSPQLTTAQSADRARLAAGTADAAIHLAKRQWTYRQGWIMGDDIQFQGHKTAYIVDVQSGAVHKENRGYFEHAEHAYEPAEEFGEMSLQVLGRGVKFNPQATGDKLDELTIAHLNLTVGGQAMVSDLDGKLKIKLEEGKSLPVTGTLEGKFAKIVTGVGQLLKIAGESPAEAMFLFNAKDSTQHSMAQVNGYVHTNIVHQFLVDRGLTNKNTEKVTQVNVNRNDMTCNAMYSGGQNYYYVGDKECMNSAYDTVVYHEYGHLVDDGFGGITNGGLSEGWGDVLAVYVSGQPIIGEDLLGAGTKVRTGDNTYKFPVSGTGPVHQLGQAWAGFAWHLRQELIKSLGDEKGAKLAEELVLPSLASNARNIPAAVKEVMLRDAVDGDVAKAPHRAEIMRAAEMHALQSYLP